MNKFAPPSAWGQTPAQRITRLRKFIKSNKERRGKAKEQTARYLEEIAEIEERAQSAKGETNDSP